MSASYHRTTSSPRPQGPRQQRWAISHGSAGGGQPAGPRTLTHVARSHPGPPSAPLSSPPVAPKPAATEPPPYTVVEVCGLLNSHDSVATMFHGSEPGTCRQGKGQGRAIPFRLHTSMWPDCRCQASHLPHFTLGSALACTCPSPQSCRAGPHGPDRTGESEAWQGGHGPVDVGQGRHRDGVGVRTGERGDRVAMGMSGVERARQVDPLS